MIQYEILISGRVQGVGFRFYVHQKASEIGIKGWVKNTVDGNVLVVAQCDESVINTFLDFLYIGPPLSRVDRISKHKMDSLSDFNNFSVKY